MFAAISYPEVRRIRRRAAREQICMSTRIDQLENWHTIPVLSGPETLFRAPFFFASVMPNFRKISPEIMIQAYAAGIFPMAETSESKGIFWLSPDPRAILPLDKIHIPKRLRRRMRSRPFSVTTDQAFEQTVLGCAKATPVRPQTWINPQLHQLYLQLHHQGFAHSLECWQNQQLAGGIFGIALNGAFFGESMFTCVPDASKIALLHLIARLRTGGFLLFDIQFTTSHLKRFGAIELSRKFYLNQLVRAMEQTADFHHFRQDDSPEAVLQSITQRS